jgi:CheY-like chemotaxis protein/DNA-binding CsgD family transcriptional regulator
MKSSDKVLIVDDNTSNVLVCQTILEPLYTLETAHDGVEALLKISSFCPDVILLDWDMPQKNGYQVLKEIKSNDATRHIQVIMMTGMMTDRENMLDAYNTGVVDFIKKPFDTLELRARVHSVMQLVNFYRTELKRKDRELMTLSMQLSENTVLFEKMMDEITGITDILPEGGNGIKNKINEIRQATRVRVNEATWKQFEEHFLAVHPGFFSRLLDKHPELTKSEIKLCALLSLNLDTKEIASILSQEYDSVRVSRTRLRKKLNLENDEKLPNYLLKI